MKKLENLFKLRPFTLCRLRETLEVKRSIPNSFEDFAKSYKNIYKFININTRVNIGYDEDSNLFYAQLEREQRRNRYSKEIIFVPIIKTESEDFFESISKLDLILEHINQKKRRVKHVKVKRNY